MARTDNVVRRTTRLTIGGHGWEEIVGDALRRIPGVAKVAVAAGHEMTVEYDPSQVSPGQFVNVARQAGYKAHLETVERTWENPAGPL